MRKLRHGEAKLLTHGHSHVTSKWLSLVLDWSLCDCAQNLLPYMKTDTYLEKAKEKKISKYQMNHLEHNFIIFISHKEKVAQLCPTLCDTMDYTVPGTLQARILEWVTVPFSRGSSNPGTEPRTASLQVDSLPSEPHVYMILFKNIIKCPCYINWTPYSSKIQNLKLDLLSITNKTKKHFK